MDSVPSSKRGQGAESGADGSRLDTDGPASALPPAVLHEVLVNDRRRAIVDRLHGTRSLRDLADDVARIEAGGDDPDRKTRQSVYITLHQCHLPKLDEFGVVAYDADRKRVEPADGLWAIRSYRDRVDEYWARQQDAVAAGPYLGLGLLGAGCLAVGTAGVAPTAAWAVASATLLTVVGLAGRTVWARRGK
jgi:hypothetical protein